MKLARRPVARLVARALPLAGFAVALVGCGSEPEGPLPLDLSGGPPIVEQQGPSDYIVDPHLRLRERSQAERDREAAEIARFGTSNSRGGGAGGGGGGSPRTLDDFRPHTSERPSQREVEAFRRQLAEGFANDVDAEDPACDQLRDTAIAGAAAARRPGQSMPDIPSARDMRSVCRSLRREFMQCLDQSYFRDHTAECQREIAREARRGERTRERAIERQAAMEAAADTDPLVRRRPGDDEDDELDEDDEDDAP